MNTDEDSSFWERHKLYIFAFIVIVVLIYFTKGCAPYIDLDDGYNQKEEYRLQQMDFGKKLKEISTSL